MRLAEFILKNVEPILKQWEDFARSLTSGSEMDVVTLRDHAEAILLATARDMGEPQTSRQQSDKSKGRGDGGEASDKLDHASEEHAIDRLGSGFNLIEVVSEYRALRASVLHLWRREVQGADQQDLDDLTRFNESIDQSLAEAVRSFTTSVEESRELFLATLGHDLRAPLNAIMLSSQVLERSGQLDEEHRGIARQISVFVNTMTGMIHDLLDFTRTRLGRGIPVSLEPVDLESLCLDVLQEFKAAHPDRTFRFATDGDIRGEWDAARLRQVLSNLVANALQHGAGDGEVVLTAGDAGPDVVVMVKNAGPPIPPGALPTLFRPFVRAARQLRSAQPREGVGLGLYISREIVTAHSGTIAVTSSESSGTVFTIRLPRKPAVRPADSSS